jgi:hypothetical protein
LFDPLMPGSRRFPPPWSVEEQSACFVVRDHNGQQLAYVALGVLRGRGLPYPPPSLRTHASVVPSILNLCTVLGSTCICVQTLRQRQKTLTGGGTILRHYR